MNAMASNEYHFVTTWRIAATPEEISAVLGDAPALARWWPSVYLRVSELEPGDASGVGKVVSLWTKGFLPHVRVLAPASLREEIAADVEAARAGFAAGRRS